MFPIGYVVNSGSPNNQGVREPELLRPKRPVEGGDKERIRKEKSRVKSLGDLLYVL